jgi:hypothetical protein
VEPLTDVAAHAPQGQELRDVLDHLGMLELPAACALGGRA